MVISTVNNENIHHMIELRNTSTPDDKNKSDKADMARDESRGHTRQYFMASIKMPTVGVEVNVAARLRWFLDYFKED